MTSERLPGGGGCVQDEHSTPSWKRKRKSHLATKLATAIDLPEDEKAI